MVKGALPQAYEYPQNPRSSARNVGRMSNAAGTRRAASRTSVVPTAISPRPVSTAAGYLGSFGGGLIEIHQVTAATPVIAAIASGSTIQRDPRGAGGESRAERTRSSNVMATSIARPR